MTHVPGPREPGPQGTGPTPDHAAGGPSSPDGRLGTGPVTRPVTPPGTDRDSCHHTRHGAVGWDGDTAVELLIANTGPSQTVVDFDDDPVLRAAAHATGRRYRIPALSGRVRPGGPHGADLVTLAWPRPNDPTPGAGQRALTVAAACLGTGGHVAILLEPTVPQTYTITWTGALLAAARDARLDYLQDIICLHTTSPHPNGS